MPTRRPLRKRSRLPGRHALRVEVGHLLPAEARQERLLVDQLPYAI
ncbi:hypothetical protein [Streptomyces scopuliridis]